ncbi:MAG: ParB/RepB/Spo0J family partition protein [Candidatus Parcubacteria bacterium]|nr:ParB/RepB/Spo0J family partition protein [Candidatus Parcubacteria bacterium]
MSLGRGLDSLIPKKITTPPPAPLPEKPDETFSGERIWPIPLAKILVNPHQPRQDFGHAALEELINSIKEHGILQPLIVTKKGDDYELIAGERRFRAAKVLELPTVPVIVREASEAQKLELALIENVQRQNLNPLEEAVAYQRLMDEFSLTQEQVAQKVSKSRAAVANTLRLLNLPEEVQEAISSGKISEGHAKVLAGLESPDEQLKFFKKIVEEELTVREIEAVIPKTKAPRKKAATLTPFLDAQKTALEEQLRLALGTKVRIEQQTSGGGRIVVEFYSDEELRELVEKIGK